jgi:hypothetical protein
MEPDGSLSSHDGLFPERLFQNAKKGCLTCEVLYLSIASRAEHNKVHDVIPKALKIERGSNYALLHYDRQSLEYFQEGQSGKPSELSGVLKGYFLIVHRDTVQSFPAWHS